MLTTPTILMCVLATDFDAQQSLTEAQLCNDMAKSLPWIL